MRGIMEVRAAPSLTSSPDEVSATCRIVVSYDWSSTRYFLPDHLNSTNVVTDASGSPIQTLDYYPYGSTRISQTTGGFNEQKQYIGQYEDPETNLSYLQARYYDGMKGEFLSEDPVFNGDPKQQLLTDPQSLNSYSYANDNPITKSDPSGRCLEDGCIVEATAALGFAGGVATQAFHDYSTGDFSRRSLGQNISTYTLAGTAGAAVAAGTALVGIQAATLGLLARLGLAGLTAGTLTAGTDLGNNWLLGQPTNGGAVLTDSAVNALSSGVLTFFPGVRGALPQSISSALAVFSKAHAARSGAEALFGTSLQMLVAAGYQFGNSWASQGGTVSALRPSGGGGGQASKSSGSASNGTSVSSWMGSFNPFNP